MLLERPTWRRWWSGTSPQRIGSDVASVRVDDDSNGATVKYFEMAYRRHLTEHPELVRAAHTELKGKDLACWCAPDLPCHVDRGGIKVESARLLDRAGT